MSQTVRVSLSMQLVDSDFGTVETIQQRPPYERTRTTSLRAPASQLVTTVATNLAMGNVTSPGKAALRNEDTNVDSGIYISIGFDVAGTFYEAIRLGPGEEDSVSLSPLRTWQVKTNTSTAVLGGYILQRNP